MGGGMRLYRRATLYDFISPFIIGFLGLSGFAASATQALVGVALSLGLSFAAKALAPKPKQTVQGVRSSLQIATDPPRDVILGEAATGGQLVYWHTFGADNKWLQLVIALASHPIQGVSEIWVNGEKVTWNSGTGAVDEFPDMTITVYDGTQVAAHSALVTNSGGRWASTAVGTGIAYAVVQAKFRPKLYKKGIPEFLFRVQGAKLYDPRTALTAYTDNPAVILYNVLRGISYNGLHLMGLRAPVDAVRSADAIAAANACDELIALAAGGSEKRYRCGLVASCGANNRDVIEPLLAAMAGKMIHAGGIYRIQAGVAQTSVASITDADMIAAEPLQTVPKKPRSQLVNAVYGSCIDPDLGHQLKPLPGRTSSSDEAEDGGIRLPVTLELSSVWSRTQGQRLMEIERKRARRQETASLVLRARYSVIEVGDWIAFTSARRGYSAKTFEVVSSSRRPDHQIDMSIREIDAAFDDWSTGDELADNASSDLPPGEPGTASLSAGTLSNIVAVTASGEERPGLSLTWTPPDDTTFVELVLEYRRVGDTLALERRIADPEAGVYSWLDGVQGGDTYEARILPVTAPAREATWSTWVQASGSTDPQVVAVSILAETVPDGSIGEDQLDAQTRFEIGLSTAVADINSSVNQRIAALQSQFERIAASLDMAYESVDRTETRITTTQQVIVSEREALASQITAAVATLQGNIDANAVVVDAIEARVTVNEGDISAQASQITSLSTTVGGHTSQISSMLTSIDGISAQWSIDLTVDGYTQGSVQLGGGSNWSFFGVVAYDFFVAQPGMTGGSPVQVFTIGNINGVPAIGITGNVIIDGSVAAQHISAGAIDTVHIAVGVEIVAPYIRNAASTSYIDLDTGDFQFG